ncbi:MAG: hypothetical protein EAX96_20720 [Candidatus Lokiarchaeota archaeon]|nr:hypothetical protein [Candidatus Lokiarchaeota archaeon]
MVNKKTIDEYRFNEVQCIASHNSYEERYIPKKQLNIGERIKILVQEQKFFEMVNQMKSPLLEIGEEFDSQRDDCFRSIKHQLETIKVRSLEFDIHEEKDGIFRVYHLNFLNKLRKNRAKIYDLEHWLKVINQWSDEYNKNHDSQHEVIVIYIDIKKIRNLESFPMKINTILHSIFKYKIYARAGFMGRWPKLGSLRGKFIFVLSGGNPETQDMEWKSKQYYHQKLYEDSSLDLRLAFLDAAPREIKNFNDRIFINTYANTHLIFLNYEVVNSLVNQGKIVRTWRTNDEITLYDTMSKGVNLIGTDAFENMVIWRNINPLAPEENSGFQKRWESIPSSRSMFAIQKRIYNMEKKNRINRFIIPLMGIIIVLLCLLLYFSIFKY